MRALLAVLILALAPVTWPAPASGQVYACHIGKTSYCFKYGQGRCDKVNNAPNKAAACAKWTSACLDCHAQIPVCLGHKRPQSDNPLCTSCRKTWLACMNRIDRRFWPNRGA